MRIKKTQVHGNKPEIADMAKSGANESKSAKTATTTKKTTTTTVKPNAKSPTRAAKIAEAEAAASKSESDSKKESKTAKTDASNVTSEVDKSTNTNKKKIKSTTLVKKPIGGNANNKKSAAATLLKRKINIMKKKGGVAKKKSLLPPKKISNELKNLGIDILLDGPKGFGLKQTTKVDDCKTSICESVKTKSRSTVSASTNYVPFMKVSKIKSGQTKTNTDKTGTEDEKKESEMPTTIKEDLSNIATTGKGDNNKKKDATKQDDENSKKVKGNETPTPVATKEGAPKKNDEQIDSLIKKGATNVKKVTAKKNNAKAKETQDKLANNEEKLTENDKDDKRDESKESTDKSVAKEKPKRKNMKKSPKTAKKEVEAKISPETETKDETSKIDEKKDEKPLETPISRPQSTTASIGSVSVSSKDVYEFSATSPVRPMIRREPIFKHKAKLKAEAAAQRQQQQLQAPSSNSPVCISSSSVAKTDVSSDDKKEVEPVVDASSEKKDEKNEESSNKEAEKEVKTPATKKQNPQKKVNAKSKATPTASINKSKEESDKDESNEDSESDTKDNNKKAANKKPSQKSKIIKKASASKKVIKKSEKQKSKEESESEDEEENNSDSSDSSVLTRMQQRRAAKTRHMKKYGFWSGPKRHREASLNALAKVHCLYENESRSALEQNLIKAAKLESLKELQKIKNEQNKKEEEKSNDEEEKEEEKESKSDKNEESSEESEPEEENKRALRTAAGVRGVGKFWENDESNLSSDQESIAQKKLKMKKVKVKDEKESETTESQTNKKKPVVKTAKAPPKKKIVSKVPLKKRPVNLPKSTSKSSDESNSDESSSESEDESKKKDAGKRKRNNSTSSMDFKNVVTKKRMASLNATAMLAATYEVERAIDKQLSEQTPKLEKAEKAENKKSNEKDEKSTEKKAKETTEKSEKGQKEKPATKKAPKKPKEKDGKDSDDKEKTTKKKPVKEKSDVKDKEKIKKEPNDIKKVKQERRDSPTKIKNLKYEADEPIRPVSTSVVIVQDTDVTITGVYVNSTQGTNQEAYCKMQYRVQSSVTEERVVRPATNEPPKSYTPLNAIASMRPPVEQMNPIHYGQPPMCDSPYLDRNYPPPPPPSAVPASSSAFCSPMPPHHDPNSGYYQPAGPLISSHLLQPQTQPPKTSTIDSDARSQPPAAAGDADSDVLITGADRPPQPYRYGPQGPQGLYARPVHQMHCPTYAPNYYSPYPQHPQEMCYPYQGPYYPPKPYPPSPFPGRYAYSYGPPPPGPSEMYDRPPPQNAPPSAGPIVAAGPSVPQHMEHYPGPQPYYPNYNPPGSQCYSRGIQPPYMDPSHYQNTCPCPMQSCPKNVLTGPLIGSKASKGPVKTEPLIANTNNGSSCSTSSSTAPNIASTQNTAAPIITCKTEELSPLPKHIIIKPEQGNNSSANTDNVDYPEQIVHAPLPINPNYVVHPELGCPENSVSPARGSIGLPQAVPLTRAEIAQSDATAPIQRRPRIGKSMERERLNFPNGCPLTDAGGTTTMTQLVDKSSEIMSAIKTEIKQESSAVKVKQEEIEEILSSEEEKMEIESVSSTMTIPQPNTVCRNTSTPRKLTPFTIEALVSSDSNHGTKASSVCSNASTNISKRKDLQHDEDSDNSVIRIEDNSSPDIPVKRRKLLSDTNPLAPKKSPPNSYKCLIKQATFKNYLPETKPEDELPATNEDTKAPTTHSNSTNKSTTSSNDDPVVVEKAQKKKSLIKRSRRRKGMKTKKVVLKIKQRMIAIPKNLRRKRKLRMKKLKQVTPKEECVDFVDMTTEDDHEQKVKEELPINVSSPSVEEVHDEDQDITEISSTMSEKADSMIKEELCEQQSAPTEDIKTEETRVFEHDNETCSTVLAETGTSTPTSQMTNIDLTIDMVARGYFSEPEILNSFAKNRLKKLKQQEGRSKSETSREKQDKLNQILKAKAKELKAKKREAKKAEKEMKKAMKKNGKQASVVEEREKLPPVTEEVVEEKDEKEISEETKEVAAEKPKVKKGRKPKNANAKEEKKVKRTKKQKKILDKDVENEKPIDENETKTSVTINNNIIIPPIIDDELPLEELVKIKKRKATKPPIIEVTRKPKQAKKKPPKQIPATETIVPVTTPLTNTDASNAKDDLIAAPEALHDSNNLVETDTVNNNKLILYNNDCNFKVHKPAQKRGKHRIKFGNKKRHRTNHASKEIEEVLIPRSVNSKPRWCNGWSWHGKPFQAKVFLNSDDPPVLRTCYPAMVHQTGDIIRPKDCVLLRAGNKRTELPYVAKIAYLWENPEDGEMMTSLLWYYRPEHTEQGRQPMDSAEEVFASRHKDHNSVACIEDKCYVLTFNEYCRYRRQLRAIEDGVTETVSIVPKLNRENPRSPPPATLPDLVMFCRRVYEFRLKRLLKQPN
ncbi:uncharacterized protein LOC134837647 [Culicoides brevitarsis]|uniref:uncharacterized protein LOC134837647 n=1 Tax=Culicoides brevitarsis TaxID=469753 RepID=UPI00307B9B09